MIELKPSEISDIPMFVAMENDDGTAEFIIPYSLDKHLAEFQKEDILYLSIFKDNALTGFFVLALENNNAIEFRRLVISAKGQGIGQAAIKLMESFCQEKFNCIRIWLDVFAFNKRGQHIYKKLGYQHFGNETYQGKELLLFEKIL